MIPTTRRALLGTGAAALTAGPASAAYPDAPVRWIVPYAPGGGSDVIARLIATPLGAGLGGTVVVENRPGGATAIGAEAVARSRPDGLTMLTADIGTLVFNPALFSRLSYDPVRDFRPVGLLARFGFVLGAGPDAPYRDVGSFLAAARREPSRVSCGTGGIGSPHHLTLERFARAAGVSLNHVPYRGIGPALTDLIAGNLDSAVLDLAAAGEALRAGQVRPLAVFGEGPVATLPGVPTAAEALGVPGFESYGWQGLVMPARTPDAAVERMSEALAAAIADARIGARMTELGLEPRRMTTAAFGRFLAAERAAWQPVLRELNISLD